MSPVKSPTKHKQSNHKSRFNTANVNELISRAGHELKSPLTAILGFTGTLLMRLPGELNKDQVEQLSIVKDSAHRLLTIINELDEFAKIELGHIEIKYEAIDCTHIIHDITKIFACDAQKKDINFAIDSSNHKNIVTSDPEILSKIIKKIIDNGIKFTAHGVIRISFEKKTIDNIKYLIIHIADSGAGIKPEDQRKLFKPFERFSQSENYSDGMGLGLHTSAKLAELINARIEYTNDKHSGSRFSIYLLDHVID